MRAHAKRLNSGRGGSEAVGWWFDGRERERESLVVLNDRGVLCFNHPPHPPTTTTHLEHRARTSAFESIDLEASARGKWSVMAGLEFSEVVSVKKFCCWGGGVFLIRGLGAGGWGLKKRTRCFF